MHKSDVYGRITKLLSEIKLIRNTHKPAMNFRQNIDNIAKE